MTRCPCAYEPTVGNPAGDVYLCPAHRGQWTVWRHGGRASDRWRLVHAGAAPDALEAYATACEGLRQGGVRVRREDGAHEAATWAPTLRTKW